MRWQLLVSGAISLGVVFCCLLQATNPLVAAASSLGDGAGHSPSAPGAYAGSADLPRAPAPTSSTTVTFTAGTAFAGGGYGVAFDAFHHTFDVVGSGGLQVVKEGSWTSAGSIALSLGHYTRIAVDSGRQLGFISGGANGGIWIFNTTTLTVVKTLTTASVAEGLTVDPSRHLLLYTNGSSVSFFDYKTLAAPASVATTSNLRVAVDPDHQLVAVSGGGYVALINETTRRWVTNVSVVASNLPVTYDNQSQQVLSGSNANNGLSLFGILQSNPVTNLTVGPMRNLQDLCMVGGGSDEALVWGQSNLVVYAVNNQTVLQTLSGSGSFPYGIAEDPVNLTALGVDPTTLLDYPYYGTVVGSGGGPAPPTSVTATPGNGTFSLSWTKSVSPSVSNYSVDYGSSPSSLSNVYSTGSSASVGATLSWSNGVPVYARVVAWVGVQPSAGSTPVASATPGAVPFPVQFLTITPSNDTLSVAWTIPASSGGFPLLNYSLGLGTTPSALLWAWSTNGASTSLQVTGLPDGVPEYVAVRPWNAVGGGHPTLPGTSIPTGIPYPVQGVSVLPSNGTLSVSWSAPASTDGSAIINYSLGLGSSPSALAWSFQTGSPMALTYTFGGLTNGVAEYVSVRAWNAAGGSTPSTPTSSSPAGVPYPVESVALTPGNGSMLVSWAPPSSDGGSPLLNYSVGIGASPALLSWSSSTGSALLTNLTFRGLTNGVPVFVAVRAWNVLGGSSLSEVVSGVPAAAPYPVRSVSIAASNDSLTVNWSTPTSDGGASILTYWVHYSTSPGGTGPYVRLTSACPCKVRLGSLTDGTAYYLSIVAENSAGNGSSPSGYVGIPAGVPYPPQDLLAVLDPNDVANLSWAAPASVDGSALSMYVLEYRDGPSSPQNISFGPSILDFVLRGLSPGSTYSFRIWAVNGEGAGNATSWVSLQTPPTSSTVPGSLLGNLAELGLLLVVVVASVVLLVLLFGRRRGRDRSKGPRSTKSSVAPPGSTAPALWSGASVTTASDVAAPSYGTYPLEPPGPEWDEGGPSATDTATPHGPAGAHAFSPFDPYVLTVRPEGIRVEALRPTEKASGGGALPVSPASSLRAPTTEDELVSVDEEESGPGAAQAAGSVASPSSKRAVEEVPSLPPLSKEDAYAVLQGLSTEPRTLDALQEATRLDDDRLLVLLGTLSRAKLVSRAARVKGAPGPFTLTVSGRALLDRSHPEALPPGPSQEKGVPGPQAVPTDSAASSARRDEPRLGELPAGQAMLHHLGLFHGHRDEPVVPPEVTQAGIAQALGTTPNSVAVTLKRMEENGVVRPDLRHVRGGKRRLKAYFLTDKGLALRSKLSQSPPSKDERKSGP